MRDFNPERQSIIGEWENWQRGKPLPSPFKHWTGEGSFMIRPEVIAGSLNVVLSFRGRDLAPYPGPLVAVSALVRGEHDADMGIPVANLRVPADPSQWNGYV